jgi:hypothetical protein
MFYSFDTKPSSEPQTPYIPQAIPQFDKGKVVTFPLAKNLILARFENIGDKFDHYEERDLGMMQLDIESFALNLYRQANPSFNITPIIKYNEVDLTNNRLVNDIQKYKWKAEEKFVNSDQMPNEETMNGSIVMLPPQSIRSFVIEFVPQGESASFL